MLSADEIQAHLAELDGWALTGKEIEKTFSFDDFAQALDFVVHVGQLADEQDHYPDIDIRFNKVRLSLCSHDVGGLTDKDFKLAKAIEQQAP